MPPLWSSLRAFLSPLMLLLSSLLTVASPVPYSSAVLISAPCRGWAGATQRLTNHTHLE